MLRFLAKTVLVLIALAAVVASGGVAGSWAFDASRTELLAKGISVGGVDVGGLTVAEARRLVDRQRLAPLRRPLTVRAAGRTFVFSADLFEVAADARGPLAEALAASRDGDFLDRVYRDVRGREVALALPLATTHSASAVEAVVARVAAAVETAPRDARLVVRLEGPRVVPSRPGLAVKRPELARLVAAAVSDPGAERTLAAPIASRRPRVTTAEVREENAVFVTVDRATRQLRLFEGLRHVKTYGVAVGEPRYPTPTGLFSIVGKAVNPSWHVPRSDWAGPLAGTIVPPGPDNPIVARWLGIVDGVGIHGTHSLSSLGRAASHGCIRMAAWDVVDLYDRVPVGTPVYIE